MDETRPDEHAPPAPVVVEPTATPLPLPPTPVADLVLEPAMVPLPSGNGEGASSVPLSGSAPVNDTEAQALAGATPASPSVDVVETNKEAPITPMPLVSDVPPSLAEVQRTPAPQPAVHSAEAPMISIPVPEVAHVPTEVPVSLPAQVTTAPVLPPTPTTPVPVATSQSTLEAMLAQLSPTQVKTLLLKYLKQVGEKGRATRLAKLTQKRQMILEELKKKGKLTRKEVMDITGVSKTNAILMLNTLEHEGKVVQHGEYRASHAYYTLP